MKLTKDEEIEVQRQQKIKYYNESRHFQQLYNDLLEKYNKLSNDKPSTKKPKVVEKVKIVEKTKIVNKTKPISKEVLNTIAKQTKNLEERFFQIMVEYYRVADENYSLKRQILENEKQLGIYNDEPF